MREHVFTPADTAGIAYIPEEGITVASAVMPINSRLSFAEGGSLKGLPLWAAAVATVDQSSEALKLRTHTHLGAMTLHTPTGDVCSHKLAIAFGEHLATMRRETFRSLQLPCVTSAHKPKPPNEYIRLPHLISYEVPGKTIEDKVIWEIMSEAEAEQWLGGRPLPNQQRIEDHLPQLLELRATLRNPHPSLREQDSAIQALLAQQDRYLSILFVYQHFELFKDTLSL